MDNITRRDLELPYIADEAVMEEQKAGTSCFSGTGKSDSTFPCMGSRNIPESGTISSFKISLFLIGTSGYL